MSKKVNKLTEPNMRLYFLLAAVFCAVTLWIEPILGLVEAGVMALTYVYFRRTAQKRREGIHRKRRTLRKNEVLPFHQEAVAHMMRTDEGLFTGHDLNLKVVQLKLVGHVDSYQTHL